MLSDDANSCPLRERAAACYRAGTSVMIVDDPADVERRTRFEGVDKIHKGKGRLGKGLAAIPIEIEAKIDTQRIFDGLPEVIGRRPSPHVLDGNGFRFPVYIGDVLLFPALHAALVAYGILSREGKHPFGQRMLDQPANLVLALLVVDIRAIIVKTVVLEKPIEFNHVGQTEYAHCGRNAIDPLKSW